MTEVRASSRQDGSPAGDALETAGTLLDRHREAARRYLPAARLIIGGESRSSGDGGVFHHVNPATGQVQAEVPLAGPREIDEAVDAAKRGAQLWQAMSPGQRRDVLIRFTELFRQEDWVGMQVLENGQPWRHAVTVAELAADYLAYYAGWADRIHGDVVVHNDEERIYTVPEPYGVVAIIITWNVPLLSIAMKVAPALAAGNAVVLKPSEFTPFTATRWSELASEAGLPDGVINVVPGGPDAGEALVSHRGVGKVSFTGGPSTAQRILVSSAANLTPAVVELGGKGANLLFADANIEEAVKFSCFFSMSNSGQGCALPTRLLVERSVYDEVVGLVEQFMGYVRVGDPLHPKTMVGPLANPESLKRVLTFVEEAERTAAGRLLLGGSRLEGELADGWFIDRTAFVDVDPQSRLGQEEIFGPVLSVIPFRDEDEAVAIANGTRYGLSNYIQTNDPRRIRRLVGSLRAGTIGVNTGICLHPMSPFGGVGVSGFGREGGKAGLDEFLQVKSVLER